MSVQDERIIEGIHDETMRAIPAEVYAQKDIHTPTQTNLTNKDE